MGVGIESQMSPVNPKIMAPDMVGIQVPGGGGLLAPLLWTSEPPVLSLDRSRSDISGAELGSREERGQVVKKGG